MSKTIKQIESMFQVRLSYLNDRLDEHPHNNTARCNVISRIDELKHLAGEVGVEIHDRKES